MILRRITEHVKAQNWTAIWIQFVLLVSGLFLGIQVANWNDVRWLACSRRILDHLDARQPYYEELEICFGTYFWSSKVQFSTTAYEQLKNRGLDLIGNKALLTEISRIHEYRFELAATENEQWDWQLLGSSVFPRHVERFRKYFPDSWMPLEDEYAKPVDCHALLDDTTVKNLLAEIISLKGFSIATNKATAMEIDALLAGIDREVSEPGGGGRHQAPHRCSASRARAAFAAVGSSGSSPASRSRGSSRKS
jgi:hypothetical protein